MTNPKISNTTSLYLLRLLLGLFIAVALFWLVTLTPQADAAAGINERVNFQARLLTNTGAVVPDGTYNIEFKIYQDGNGILGGGDETLEWTETRTGGDKVTVKNGYFSVYLGSVTAFGSSVDWNQDTLWLSINIGGTGAPSWDGEMDPFTRLSSTPYALNSKYLGGLQASNFVQLAQGVQTDASSSNPSIYINKTVGTANILQLQRGGTDVVSISNGGSAVFRTTTDSTTGFQVLDADGGVPVLNIDTDNERVGIGLSNPSNKLSVSGNSNFAGKIAVGSAAVIDDSAIAEYGSGIKSVINVQQEYTDLSATLTGGITNHVVLNSSANASTVQFGGFNEVRIKSGNDKNYAALIGTASVITHEGTGTLGAGYALQALAQHKGTNTITSLAAIDALTENESTATITTAAGIRAGINNINVGGTITNGYGVLIDSANAGTLTNYYGLYIADGPTVGSTNYGIFSLNRALVRVASTTALEVQDASNNSALKVNTTDGQVSINEGKVHHLNTWSTAGNALPEKRKDHGLATYNGYMYVIGGHNDTARQTTVYYAKVRSDGSPDTWNTTTAIGTALDKHRAIAANGYMYVIGGDTGSVTSTVSVAKINADGTLGSWSTTTALPEARQHHGVEFYNGYLYVVGGHNGSAAQSTVYYAKPNVDGTVSSWTTASNPITTASSGVMTGVLGGYLYAAGGSTTDIYYSKLAENGAPGTWTTNGTGLFFAVDRDMVEANGKLYMLGANFFGCGAEVGVFTQASDGSLASGTTTDALPTNRCKPKTAVVNGYLYAVGGFDGTDAQTTVYYGSLPRTQINGSLDLVTLSGINNTDDGGLSTLFAGDIHAVGGLTVQGNQLVNGRLTVNDGVVARAAMLLESTFRQQTVTDSATAFQVFDADGGTAVLTIDTVDERVGIGGPPANGLLTIGTNTTAASGGLYFGTDTNLYRAGNNQLKTDDDLIAAGDIYGDAGTTIYGGTGSGDDLTLKGSSHGTDGTIFLGSPTKLLSGNRTLTGAMSEAMLGYTDTLTLDFASATAPAVVSATGTVVAQQSLHPFGAGGLFFAQTTLKNANGVAANLSPFYTLAALNITQADGASISQSIAADILSGGTFNVINGGTLATGSYTQLWANSPSVGSGVTITTRYGVVVSNPTGAGTTTTNYGILIGDQTHGGSDYGLAIEGADTQALWISSAVDTTDAANGIGFGFSRDTKLYRGAANTLQTDGDLQFTTGGTRTIKMQDSASGAGSTLAILGATGQAAGPNAGGQVTLTGGTGGSSTGLGAGGAGGAVTIAGGGTYSNNWTGPVGGAVNINGGSPMASVAASSSTGGAVNINGGTGGSASGFASSGGGAGGAVAIAAGNGGIAAGGGNQTGGAGANMTLSAGSGGTSIGSAANSNGGSITLTAGSAGTGGGGAAGTPGSLNLQTATGGAVNIAVNGIANTVQIGNTSGAVTQTINIGNNATASSTSNVNIGSSIAGTVAVTGPTTVTGRTSGTGTALSVSNSTSTGTIASFLDNATAVFTLADGGAATFRNQTDSAAGFSIQDAASAVLLAIDTATRSGSGGNLVKVGNSTGTDADTTILQLDGATANPTTNLSALNGGLFYNSTTNKVMIIENGTVKTVCNTTDAGCGAGGSGARLDQVTAANTNANIDNVANNIIWNWTLAGAETGLKIGEASASTGGGAQDQFLMSIETASGSTASPFRVVSTSVDAADIVFNMASAGDIEFQDNGTAFFTLSDIGGIAIALDGTDNPAYTLTNSGSSNVTTNLAGTGDYVIQDNGTDVFTVRDNGTALFKSSANSTTAFQVAPSDTTTPVFNIDTTNRRVGVNTSAPEATFQVGDVSDQGDVHIYGEITRKGVTQQTGLTGINDVFVYDITADSDGGAWADSEISRSLSWYNEAKDDGIGDACNIASDDRCGSGRFPRKAIIVATNDAVYIFDAVDQKLFMKFTQNGTGHAIGVDTNNNPSSVFALNGVVYVGANGSAAGGLYAIDFTQDRLYNYNTTDRDQGDKNIANRNTTVTYNVDSRTRMAIRHNAVNAVHGAVLYGSSSIQTNGGPLNGATFIAAATDDSMSVINLSLQETLDYGDNLTDQFSSVYVTRRGRLYGMNVTLAQVERYGTQANGAVGIDVARADQATPDDLWDEQAANLPNLSKTTPTFLVGAPDALKVLERGSLADDAADRIYVGHSLGMTEIHDVNAPSATVIGWSQFVSTAGTTMHMSGNPKGMFRFDEATGDLADDTRSASILEPEVAPTYGVPGVRGTGLRFDGASQFLCSDANNDGTCDTDADFNVAAISSHIKVWFKHSPTVTGTDVLIDRRYTAFAGTEGIGYTIEMNSSGQMIYGIQDTAATAAYDDSVTSTQSYNDGQWHYLVAVNTDTAICLFIDGKLSVACDATLAATGTLDASQILFIGADGSGAAGGNFWDGDIDDVYFAGNGSTVSSNQTQTQIRKQYLAGRSALARPSTRVDNATAFSASTIGDSGESYVMNAFAGSIVEITSGTGAGQTRRIVGNDGTTLTVSPDWSVTPDATSDYEVMPEQLYGSSDVVTSIGMSDANAFLGTSRNLYIGTSNGDGGGITAFGGYGNEYVTDVYHSNAAVEDSSGNDWTGTDADDIRALDADNGNLVIASEANLWREKFDRNILQELDSIIGNLGSVRAELIVDGLLGATSETGNIGGADLAERYTSYEELEAGDVVALEDNTVGAVRKSSAPYDPKLLGVVATNPGLIIGPAEESSYPIALSGRVPVKVILKPGESIKSGDRLTSSELSGYATKAVQSGRVLGTALEDVMEEYLVECPTGAPEGTRCGTVQVFINLVDFNGQPVELAIADFEDGGLELSDTVLEPVRGWVSLQGDAENGLLAKLEKSDKVIRYLLGRKNQISDVPQSEILTDRISAVDINGVDIFAQNLYADSITVNRLKANQIEGLELFVNSISDLPDAQTPSTQSEGDDQTAVGLSNGAVNVENLTTSTATVAADLNVNGTLFANGALKVAGPVEFLNQSIFHKVATFIDKVIFRNDVSFEGKVAFNTDTAGYAIIHPGQQEVKIVFDEPFEEPPVVTLTVKNAIFVDYAYKDLAPDGFTIVLKEPAVDGVEFSWTALSVPGAKTTQVVPVTAAP